MAKAAGAGICVNAIACGGILTPPMKQYLSSRTDEDNNRIFQLMPLGRLAEPEEHASLAVYLAPDEHYLVGPVNQSKRRNGHVRSIANTKTFGEQNVIQAGVQQ